MGLGSGIRKKPSPDPGCRGQKGTGSRIPDSDPQHCIFKTIITCRVLNLEADSLFYAVLNCDSFLVNFIKPPGLFKP
jgi:hypothetical protein